MILHLMTQRDQPYGSERRCCEHCGLMLVARDETFWKEHAYVDDEAAFHAAHPGHDLTLCTDKATPQGAADHGR